MSLAAAVAGCQESDKPADKLATTGEYQPAFFNAGEWAFIQAACDRLIPPTTLARARCRQACRVHDRHMQTPHASGDIWYMQGPFHRSRTAIRLSGPAARARHLRVGMKAIDEHCRGHFGGKAFARARARDQETLLKAAEAGKLELRHLRQGVFQSTSGRNPHGLLLRPEVRRQQETWRRGK